MFFDNSIFGSAKEGFVITTDKIYVKNPFETSIAMHIRDVKTISYDEKNIYLNDSFRIEIAVCRLSKPELVNIFSYCISYLLLFLNKATQEGAENIVSSNTTDCVSSDVNMNRIEQGYNAITHLEHTWECSCGKDVSTENKFCPNCGAKQPKINSEWVCSSCGKQNSKDSNFCGQCGTKKE